MADSKFIRDLISAQQETLNYLWVGGPPEFPMGVPGHDIAGPIRMAQMNKKDKVVFWCLDDQVKHYSSRFAKEKNIHIEVKSMQQYIADCSAHPSAHVREAAEKMKIMERTLFAEDRRQTRDRVTFKVAFSLFLLLTQGGYVLDTNVKPKNATVRFPPCKKFMIPVQTLPTESKRAISDVKPECWLMGSPSLSQNTSVLTSAMTRAKLSFEMYLTKWKQAEDIFEKEGYSRAYHHRLGGVIPAVYQPNDPESDYFEYDTTGDIAEITSLSITKYYYSTHEIKTATSNITPLETAIISAVRDKDVDQLSELLTYADEYKQQDVIQNVKNNSLEQAVKQESLPCIEVLMQHQAKLSPEMFEQVRKSADDTLKKGVINILSKNAEQEELEDYQKQPNEDLSLVSQCNWFLCHETLDDKLVNKIIEMLNKIKDPAILIQTVDIIDHAVMSILHRAIRAGSVELVQFILEKEAQLNSERKLEYKDDRRFQDDNYQYAPHPSIAIYNARIPETTKKSMLEILKNHDLTLQPTLNTRASDNLKAYVEELGEKKKEDMSQKRKFD